MVENPYSGQEHLLLVEMLALKAIGLLDDSLEKSAQSFSPLLAKKTGMVGASWDEMLMKLMSVDAKYLEEIQLLWKRYGATVVQHGGVPDAREFARLFVHENYRNELAQSKDNRGQTTINS